MCFVCSLRQTFFADPFVQEHVRLDAVVCLCDSPRLLRTLVAPPSPPTPPSAPVVASAADGAGVEGSALAEEGSGQTGDSGAAAAAAAALVMSQLALSDRVLLNKSDLITPAEVSLWHPRCSRVGCFDPHPFRWPAIAVRRVLRVEFLALCPVGARTIFHHPGRQHHPCRQHREFEGMPMRYCWSRDVDVKKKCAHFAPSPPCAHHHPALARGTLW